MVYWSVTIISPAKMAKLIEMLFGVWTLVGTENHMLDGGPDPSQDGAISRGTRCSLFRELCKNGCIDQDAVWEMDSGEPNEACSRWGSHCRHLENTNEPSVCGLNCPGRHRFLTEFSSNMKCSSIIHKLTDIFTKQTLMTSFVKC